ncbi:hypothetical protein CBM2589_A90917 [Cupriavidus taiwanensis]|uniref:Uncharacterized protein n=1 Tax=Cupriavidus taiwanensis TaxID=164546 RepID=A0A975XH18_9BURK|nr:hypothetical protein CBM2589_A90917 [Cupriavidus taiwanensis]
MISVPIAAATQVATNTASLGMPASPRIEGLTKMMYAIVRNVVMPARISVRTSVWCSRSLNSRSSSDVAAWGAAGVDVPGLEAGSGIDMNGLLCLIVSAATGTRRSVPVPVGPGLRLRVPRSASVLCTARPGAIAAGTNKQHAKGVMIPRRARAGPVPARSRLAGQWGRPHLDAGGNPPYKRA